MEAVATAVLKPQQLLGLPVAQIQVVAVVVTRPHQEELEAQASSSSK
jgi:hypothetical protein